MRVRGNLSSQFVTALLIALPLARRECVLEIEGELISKPYVEMTLNTLRRFGVDVERHDWSRFVVPATSGYRSPGEVFVEGDASSASYFLAAGAIGGLRGGGAVRVEGVGRDSIQGDVRFTEILERMGARITMGENWIEATAGEEAKRRGKLRALDADLNHIPDAAMTAAMAALFADGPSTLRNIGSWRVKETDRIAAMATELRKFGAVVEEGADYLRITPPPGWPLTANPSSRLGARERLRLPSHLPPPVTVDTYDDHRMAMCFSLAALGRHSCAHQRSGVRAQDLPAVFRRARFDFAMTHATGSDVPVIAIDGPSASGKGTVAQRVAGALGFHFLDSGALYRLVGLAALERGVELDRVDEVAQIARELDAVFSGRDDPARWPGRDRRDSRRSGERCRVAGRLARAGERRAARAPAGVPETARPGGGRTRHGLCRFPRRGAQNLSHGRSRREGAQAL